MRKFVLMIAAVAGVAVLAGANSAEANSWNRPGQGYGGYSWNGGNRGYYNPPRQNNFQSNFHHDCYPVRQTRPVGPVIQPYPYPVQQPYYGGGVYRPYPVYQTGPNFGLVTPNFGLIVN